MALETGNYIGDLVVTNPTAADPKAQGDDHLRLIKDALRKSFAGFTGAVVVTGTDGGAVDAYTVTPATPVPSYAPRMTVIFSPTATNTGAATVSISSLGPKALKRVDGTDVQAGDLFANVIYAAAYNGTEFRLLSITKNQIDQLSFSSALPAQTLGFLRSNGAVAGWTATHTGYAQNEVLGAPIASAATINLSTATGNLVHVTGTTTITAITIPVGAERTVIFDGALTLTHGTGLLLPGVANIITAAGDRAIVRGDTGGAIVTSYERASGLGLTAAPLLHVREESAGVGGAAISGTQDRVLNTVVTNTIPSASLASSQITLPAGTYDYEISAPAYSISRHRASLYNVTDGVTTQYGTSEFNSTSDQVQTRSTVAGRVTITAPKTFKVQHYTGSAGGGGTSALGAAASDSRPEVYTEARFWKVA